MQVGWTTGTQLGVFITAGSSSCITSFWGVCFPWKTSTNKQTNQKTQLMSTCCKQPLFQASSRQRGGRWRETPEGKPRRLTSCGWFPHTRWGREGGEGGGYPRHRWGRDDASQKPLKPLLVSCLLFAECSQSPRAHSLNGAAINGLILCSYTGITLQLHWRTLVSLTAASWLDSQWFPHPQAPLPKRRRRDLVRKPMGDERQQPTTATDTAPPPGWGWGIF